MKKLSAEERIQAIYDLKVGYKLGHADVEILKGMARRLLATEAELQEYRKAAEPIYQLRDWHWYDAEKRIYDEVTAAGGEGRIVYATPQPVPATRKPVAYMNRFTSRVYALDEQPAPAVEAVPVVPDEIDKWQAIDDMRDHEESFRWDSATGYAEGWNACRAAMQQPVSNRDELPDWIKCSERMPEADKWLFLFGREVGEECEPYVKDGYLAHNGRFYYSDGDNGSFGSIFADEATVTHWTLVYVPAAPQQE